MANNCGLLLNDGVSFLQLNSPGDFLLLNDATCELAPGQSAVVATYTAASLLGSGAPPILGAWEKWWDSAKAFEELLADPEAKPVNLSPMQLRLLRRQRMYEEMLMDASPRETRKIEARLREIRIKMGRG